MVAKKGAKKPVEPVEPVALEPDPVLVVPGVSLHDGVQSDVLGRLTARILLEVEWQLNHAPPAARRELLKSVIPALFRSNTERDADLELEELRAQVAANNEQTRMLLYSMPAQVVEVKGVPLSPGGFPVIDGPDR
jgi:hypothetical protein